MVGAVPAGRAGGLVPKISLSIKASFARAWFEAVRSISARIFGLALLAPASLRKASTPGVSAGLLAESAALAPVESATCVCAPLAPLLVLAPVLAGAASGGAL